MNELYGVDPAAPAGAEELITLIQKPTFQTVGAYSLETFFPANAETAAAVHAMASGFT